MTIRRINRNTVEFTKDEKVTITRPFDEVDHFLDQNPKWKKALEAKQQG